MNFGLVGIDHKKTPIEVREKIHFYDIDSASEKIQGYLRDFFKVDLSKDQVVCLQNDQALRHLFNTAIGLESLIVG